MAGPGARMAVAAPRSTPQSISLLTSAEPMTPLTEPAGGTGGTENENQRTDGLEGWPSGDGVQPGLATTVAMAPDLARPGTNPERWLNGITYQPETCGDGTTEYLGYVAGSAAPTQTKSVDTHATAVTTDPFLVLAGDTCSSIGWESHDYVGRALRLLGKCEARLVEREFWTGTASQAAVVAGLDYSATQYLAQSTTCTILNSSTAVNPDNAIALLHDYLAQHGCGGQGMIHVPRIGIAYIQAKAQLRRDGARLRDVLDNVVVPGAGYTGSSPAGVAAAPGTVWVYATGPVRFWRSDTTVLPASYEEAMGRNATPGSVNNSFTFYAERPYLVDWDRCVHAAVKMTLADT